MVERQNDQKVEEGQEDRASNNNRLMATYEKDADHEPNSLVCLAVVSARASTGPINQAPTS